MGPIARVLWQSLPELIHIGAVLAVSALMLAVMGVALFGDRAALFSTFSGISRVCSCRTGMRSTTPCAKYTATWIVGSICCLQWQAGPKYLWEVPWSHVRTQCLMDVKYVYKSNYIQQCLVVAFAVQWRALKH